jgi:hypothetical protein
MKVDFTGAVGTIENLRPGAFFVSRDNQRSFAGIRAVYGSNEVAAVLLNLAVNADEHFPSLVQGGFLGGQDLIEVSEAALRPCLNDQSLQFTSETTDGPGSLIFGQDRIWMRVARRWDGFFYLDVRSGVIDANRPPGIEIVRWSIFLADEVLFRFDGPKPYR